MSRWFSHNSFSNNDLWARCEKKTGWDQLYYSNSQDNYNLVTPSVGRLWYGRYGSLDSDRMKT